MRCRACCVRGVTAEVGLQVAGRFLQGKGNDHGNDSLVWGRDMCACIWTSTLLAKVLPSCHTAQKLLNQDLCRAVYRATDGQSTHRAHRKPTLAKLDSVPTSDSTQHRVCCLLHQSCSVCRPRTTLRAHVGASGCSWDCMDKQQHGKHGAAGTCMRMQRVTVSTSRASVHVEACMHAGAVRLPAACRALGACCLHEPVSRPGNTAHLSAAP